MKRFLTIALAIFLIANFASAATTVNDIMAPVNKIYDLIKSIVSVLGIIAITVAGSMYMFAGGNMMARENAKSMVSYAVVGIVLVWAAPLAVSYLTGV